MFVVCFFWIENIYCEIFWGVGVRSNYSARKHLDIPPRIKDLCEEWENKRWSKVWKQFLSMKKHMVYYDWVYRHNYQCGVLVDLIWLLPSKDSKHCKNPFYFREGKHGACVETPDWLALLLGVLNHFPEVFFGHGPLRWRLTSPKVPGLMSVLCLFFCPIWFRWRERFPMPCKRFHWKPCSTEKIRSFKRELWQKSRWKNGR